MPREIPDTIETFTALRTGPNGGAEFLAADPTDAGGLPGFDANLVPFYVLSDRGSYFIPGSFKKTARERMSAAPHLWQHDTWVPIGKHTAAGEQEDGFHISVHVNEDVAAGRELMSNLRFGVPMGVSVGFDRIRDRSGTEEDDAKLDRSVAPDFYKNVPINELRAITEARWWESSSVTFAGIASAKPGEVRSGDPGDTLTRLINGLSERTISDADLTLVKQIVAAHEGYAAHPGTPDGTEHLARPDRRGQLAEVLMLRARYLGLTGE